MYRRSSDRRSSDRGRVDAGRLIMLTKLTLSFIEESGRDGHGQADDPYVTAGQDATEGCRQAAHHTPVEKGGAATRTAIDPPPEEREGDGDEEVGCDRCGGEYV